MPKLKSGFVFETEVWDDGDVYVRCQEAGEAEWFPPGTEVHVGELIVYTETDKRVRGIGMIKCYQRLITQEEYESMNTS